MTGIVGNNPFATRFTRPGAIEFMFSEGQSPASLVEKLRESRWQGEIVGPHGVGKSTLLAALIPHLVTAGRTVVHVTLHAGEKTLPAVCDEWPTWSATTLVIVDGYEQLTWWSRGKLAKRVKDRGAGLLVTTHAPTGLPTLMNVVPQCEVAEQVVRQLVPDETLISSDDIHTAYQDCQGNIREMLFALYDLYETRTRS